MKDASGVTIQVKDRVVALGDPCADIGRVVELHDDAIVVMDVILEIDHAGRSLPMSYRLHVSSRMVLVLR